MTEQEWLACDNVEVMLSSLGGNASERKVRLFAVACNRSVWHLLPDDWCKDAVEIAERLADGNATEQERVIAHAIGMELMGLGDPPNEPLAAALSTLEKADKRFDGPTPLFGGAFATASAAAYALANAESGSGRQHTLGSPAWHASLAQAEQQQRDLLRDIFGPLPFRHITLHPSSLSRKAANLAQEIYDNREFDRLPSLADALEADGCDNAEILAHCRGPGPHVLGCWVVDLILGET
jgi:hypothetical protein